MDYEGRVTAREALRVAGLDRATYRLEMRLFFADGLNRRVTRWVDPAWGLALKSTTESRRSDGSVEIRALEAVSLHRGG